jgi:hypothetical protein
MALDPNVLIGGLVTVCTAWLKVSQTGSSFTSKGVFRQDP